MQTNTHNGEKVPVYSCRANTCWGRILLTMSRQPNRWFAEFELPEGGSRASARLDELYKKGITRKEDRTLKSGIVVKKHTLKKGLKVKPDGKEVTVWKKDPWIKKWFNFDK